MIKEYIISIFIILIVLIASAYFWSKTQLIPIRFNSLHPQIEITKQESYLFDIYTNFALDIKNRKLWDVKPKILGIFYTDKVRADNRISDRDNLIKFGSTITRETNSEVSIYIYVSESVINSADAKEKIKDYTLDVIGYYQFLENERKDDVYTKFFKLPINVKKI